MNSRFNNLPIGVVFAAIFLFSTHVFGFTPSLINYQGRLTDTSGTALTGTYSVTFDIYAVPSGGSPIWTENHASVSVSAGLFNILLGSTTPLNQSFFADTLRFLGVKVGSDPEIAPRTQLVTVPYAFRVSTIDSSTGGIVVGNTRINGSLVVGTGNGFAAPNSFIAGSSNSAGGPDDFAIGTNNFVNAPQSIAIGWSNVSNGSGAVVHGVSDSCMFDNTTIGGGLGNLAGNRFATVGGGNRNQALGYECTVSGGGNNIAAIQNATVGGGDGNSATFPDATVSGGRNNSATNNSAVIGGGLSNIASGISSAVCGGDNNTASANYALICGGTSNRATAPFATIGGGIVDSATAQYATVPGGSGNTAAGLASFAAGFFAKARHNGAFVWSDNSTVTEFSSSAINEFSARCTGGARFASAVNGVGAPTAGVSLAPGGGSWSSISDRNLKENVKPIDEEALLKALAAIPVSTWNYIAQDKSIRHIGPMAQDFYKAFGVGEDNRHITTIDADGVALAAIKALINKTKELDDLKAQVTELKKMVGDLSKK